MLLPLLGLIAAVSLPPKPDHYVTDRAGVLSAERAATLDHTLAEFERATSDQILVYVDRRIPEGTTIEEMGAEAIRQWGVGQKGKDNGAILFLFLDDRAMRIEVGYGLEGALTDAKSKSILENVIKPELQRGDVNAAVERGAAAIIATVRGEPYQGTGQTVAEKPRGLISAAVTWGYFILFLLAAVAQFITARRLVRNTKLSRSERRPSLTFRLIAIAPVVLVLVFLVSMPKAMIADAAACYLILLIVPFVVGLFAGIFAAGPGEMGQVTFSHSGASSSSDSSSSHSYSSSYSSSSSSSSSSSFSGGGGSGGGGGASGSW